MNNIFTLNMFVSTPFQLKSFILQSDHLCVTALNKAGNISQAFTNTKKLLTVLSKQLKFERDPRFGYVTFDPGLVGTGLRAR